jgi:hypothetical protein
MTLLRIGHWKMKTENPHSLAQELTAFLLGSYRSISLPAVNFCRISCGVSIKFGFRKVMQRFMNLGFLRN